MDYSTYFAVATLVLGWFLSEASQYLRTRFSRLKATNRALCDLLEIRHRVNASQQTLNLISEKFSLGPIPRNQIRGIMPTPLKVDESIRQRFNDAVSDLANYDPFLAYSLRGKDIFGVIETFFTSLETEDINIHQLNNEQMELLGKDILPILDSIILKVAIKSGLLNWFKAKRCISKKTEIPEEYKEFLDKLANTYRANLKSQDFANQSSQK